MSPHTSETRVRGSTVAPYVWSLNNLPVPLWGFAWLFQGVTKLPVGVNSV